MSQARAPCPNCELPFYADRNTACPYCGSTPADAPEESAGAAGHRSRVTCSDCGLPHYEDTEGGCPYCTAAENGDHAHEADAPAGIETEATGTEADTAEETESPGQEATGTADPQASTESASTAGTEQESASQSGGRSSSGGVLGFIKGLFGR